MSFIDVFKNGQILKTTKSLLKNTENPCSILLFYLGLKNECIVKLKNNYGLISINLKNKYLINSLITTMEEIERNENNNNKNLFKLFIKELDNEIVTVDNIKFLNNSSITILFEYFVDQPFLLDNMEGRTIIDIGANIGDTPLYYANRGGGSLCI